jgi:outer membrane protein TolC
MKANGQGSQVSTYQWALVISTAALLPALPVPVVAQQTAAMPENSSTTPAVPAEAGPNAASQAGAISVSASSLEQRLARRPTINGTLTIDKAGAIALRESPIVRGATAEVEAALGRVSAARAERRPFITANLFATDGTFSNLVGSPPLAAMPGMQMNVPRGAFFDQNVSLMYPLYTSGRLRTLVRQAEALRNASQADLEVQRQDIILLTRTAYREVQARRALVDVQQARLQENEEELRLDRTRVEEGKLPPFSVLRQEAEVAATQQELTNAKRDVELAVTQLKTVMGVNPASNLEITASLAYQPSAELLPPLIKSVADLNTLPAQQKTLPALPSATTIPTPAPLTAQPQTSTSPAELPALLRVAEHSRPELQAAAQRVAAAVQEISSVRSAFRPQVNAFGLGDIQKMRGDAATGGVTYGIAASVPIFSGGQRGARVQQAEAMRRKQEAELDRLSLQIAQEVTNAILNVRAAEQNIGTAQAALKSAQEDYRLARIRYEAGKSVFVEVLDAQTTRVRAESNVVQALYSYNVAYDQLLRAIGTDGVTS